MRIGLVVPGGVDPPGGDRVIPFVHHLVESLSAEHEVTVVAIGHDTDAGEWTLFGAHVVNVPLGTHSKADIARVLVQVPRAMARHGRPDVVHGLWANLPGLAAVAAARRYSVPSVVSVCGGELASVPSIAYGGGLRSGTRLLATAALRGATEVTVATEWMHQHVRVSRGGRVGEIVPLGADLRHLAPGAGTDTATDPDRLVHVGGLNRVKDQDLLLRAFALLAAERQSLSLTIAGGDTLDGHHRRLAHELGVADRVTFLGHVPHDALGGLLHGAALHVLTSHHDAGPLAVLEAAACGVPTVGTCVGHVADFARMPMPAAVAVHDRAPASMAAAIGELLDDRSRRDALAARAQHWAVQHDAAFTATAFDSLYRRLSARRMSA
jgi:glycosyltransferase involved in cell wall biosynthesis